MFLRVKVDDLLHIGLKLVQILLFVPQPVSQLHTARWRIQKSLILLQLYFKSCCAVTVLQKKQQKRTKKTQKIGPLI